MASILMGVITAILVILSCGGCFAAGYSIGYKNQPEAVQPEKVKESDGYGRMAEGFANIMNYANRHGAGDKK